MVHGVLDTSPRVFWMALRVSVATVIWLAPELLAVPAAAGNSVFKGGGLPGGVSNRDWDAEVARPDNWHLTRGSDSVPSCCPTVQSTNSEYLVTDLLGQGGDAGLFRGLHGGTGLLFLRNLKSSQFCLWYSHQKEDCA